MNEYTLNCPIKINLNLVIYGYSNNYHKIQSIVLIIDELNNYFWHDSQPKKMGIMPNFSMHKALSSIKMHKCNNIHDKQDNNLYIAKNDITQLSSIINAPIFGGFGPISSLIAQILKSMHKDTYQSEHQVIQNQAIQHQVDQPLGGILYNKNIANDINLSNTSNASDSDINAYNAKSTTEYTTAQDIGWDTKLFMQQYKSFVVTGGEHQTFQPIKIPNMHIVIMKPNTNIATKTIFDKYHKSKLHKDENTIFDCRFDIPKNITFDVLCRLLHQTGNSLEQNITKQYPSIKSILNILRKHTVNDGYCGITGTGSGIFIICQHEKTANCVYAIAQNLSSWTRKIYWKSNIAC